jgi:hypothetical protein
MKGNEFIDSVMRRVGRSQVLTTDTTLRAIALEWLNTGVRDISGRHEHWTWLEKTASFPTVADQLSYDLPADIDLSGRKVFSVKQEDSPAKLVYIDQNTFDALEPEPTSSSGYPYYYTLWSKAIRLYPMPSSVITMYMRYIKTVTSLTDSATSETDIPSKHDNVVIDGALVYAFMLFPSFGNSQQQRAVYELGIKRMIQDNNIVIGDDGISFSHSIGSQRMKDPYSFDKLNVG